MILVGELEYTDKMMAPDGRAGFLFVGDEGVAFQYSISPYPEIQSWHVGDNYVFAKHLSVTEFLQQVVNEDIAFSSNVVKMFVPNVGVRLKGMTEWITRK